jgi:hypothetical protein
MIGVNPKPPSQRAKARAIAEAHGLTEECARTQLRRADRAGLSWEEWRKVAVDASSVCPVCKRIAPTLLHAPTSAMVCRRCLNGLGSLNTPEILLAAFDLLSNAQ